MIEIQKVRQQTPACSEIAFLNNAGSSLPPDPVVDTMISYLKLESRIGGYLAAQEMSSDISQFYIEAASLINAKSADEIAYCESATHGWQRVFYSIPLGVRDRVFVFESEYCSFYMSVLQRQKRDGFTIEIIPTLENGDVDLESLKSKLDENVKLVLLGHMPTQSGILNPVEEVGAILREHPCLFILDATQTVGQYPVDVQKIGCDALCATGRKFLRGPRGAGFLYVKNSLAERLDPNVIDMGGAFSDTTHTYRLRPNAKRFEVWERNYAVLLGLGQALTYLNKLGIDNVWNRVKELSAYLRKELIGCPNLKLCDPGTNHGAIVTFNLSGVSCADLVGFLRDSGVIINYSMREYARLDFEKRGLIEVCRASPHYFNTKGELDKLVNLIRNY